MGGLNSLSVFVFFFRAHCLGNWDKPLAGRKVEAASSALKVNGKSHAVQVHWRKKKWAFWKFHLEKEPYQKHLPTPTQPTFRDRIENDPPRYIKIRNTSGSEWLLFRFFHFLVTANSLHTDYTISVKSIEVDSNNLKISCQHEFNFPLRCERCFLPRLETILSRCGLCFFLQLPMYVMGSNGALLLWSAQTLSGMN